MGVWGRRGGRKHDVGSQASPGPWAAVQADATLCIPQQSHPPPTLQIITSTIPDDPEGFPKPGRRGGWEKTPEKGGLLSEIPKCTHSHLAEQKSWPRVLPGAHDTTKQAQPGPSTSQMSGWDALASLPFANLSRLLLPN